MENSNFEFEGFTSFNKKYIFKGKISEENLIITTSNDYDNDVIKNNFILDINFNELKKIKIFSLYETLEEAVNGLISIIENNLESKKNNVVDEETNKITLTIPVFFGKFKEIKFEFTLKPKNIEDKIDSLISTINTLKKENESLKLFKEQNEKYLNIISFFFSFIWKEKIFQYFYKFAEEVMKSNILKSFLSNLVNEFDNNGEKKNGPEDILELISLIHSSKINLLYRATENGDKISQIYKCFNEINNKPKEKEIIFTFIKVNNTIIFFLTKNIWEITNKFYPIDFCFITLNNIFRFLNNKISKKKGIFFTKEKIKIGKNFIEINDNFLKNKSCSIKQSNLFNKQNINILNKKEININNFNNNNNYEEDNNYNNYEEDEEDNNYINSNEEKWPKINEIFDLNDKNPQNYSFKIDEMEIIYFCLEKNVENLKNKMNNY